MTCNIRSDTNVKFAQVFEDHSHVIVQEIWNAPKAHLLASLINRHKNDILIISNGAREDRYFENLQFFTDYPLVEIPSFETLPGENIPPSPDILGKRLKSFYDLMAIDKPKIILCPLQSLLQKIPDIESLKNLYQEWRIGSEHPFDQLEPLLEKLGYKRAKIVSDKNEYAVRGGILDIFPSTTSDPYRIEFFGDTIDSIRSFDPISQKSIGKKKSFFLSPASELHFMQEAKSLHHYLKKNTHIVFDDLVKIEDDYVAMKSLPGSASPNFLKMEALLQEIQDFSHIYFTKDPLESLSQIKQSGATVQFELLQQSFSAHLFHHTYAKPDKFFQPEDKLEFNLLDHLQDFDLPNLQFIFLYEHDREKTRLKSELENRKLKNYKLKKGYLTSGFVLTDQLIAIISDFDLSQKKRVRRQKYRSTYHTPAAEFHELLPGELVVHFHSGIGKYLGTEKQKNHLGLESEFMVIEYAKDSKLFVPMTQAHLVSRYIGSSETAPRLSDLGSKKWHQIKTKAQKEIIGYASELLHLYAERQLGVAFAHPEDSSLMQEFEEDFPYTETLDQLNSISAIKQDMGQKKPMDRLICGDVGYGKTEVAMRSAFKAVADGKKQVAVLVPTTVLAMQHYDTFKERMSNFPVVVGVLSRFHTPKKNKETLEKIKEGRVDIVIGTHRILSKDVTFKDLGLIIIDEEQRFGVRSKEHLKKLKKGAHTLTLSATPIPRTLYMSLISARDMSVISTPPQDRLPIKTIIAETDEEIIKNACLRELAREGQIFFIHNRVGSIYSRAKAIQKLVPHAKIGVVHGQMPPEEVDDIFHQFKSGLIHILFATTIIENGIDVPNANTVLIDRADTYGLADLYQLRGRVGRWNKAAYAYFLIPKKGALTEVARKRLHALMESSGYGGGMKIAMRDLEIRGAGDILGVQQSGEIASIGFHLYCKLLKRTIEAIKRKKPISFTETKIEFPFNASLSEQYINESSIRMEVYHRLGECQSALDVDHIFEELEDRFGKPPESAIYLYHLSRIRVFAAEHHFTHLKFRQNEVFAERQLGKKVFSTRIYLSKKIASPKDLEEAMIRELTTKFALKVSE